MFNYLKFKELRKKKNIPIDTFSDLLGVSKVTVYAYQSGKLVPNEETIKIISDKLGINYIDLISENIKQDWKQEAYDVLKSENKRLWLMIEYLTKGNVTFDVGKMLGNRENVGAKTIALSVTPSKLRA